MQDSSSQFHQRYMRTFFVPIFQQSQNVTRKMTFVRKIRTYTVDEIDTWMSMEYLFMSLYLSVCLSFLLFYFSIIWLSLCFWSLHQPSVLLCGKKSEKPHDLKEEVNYSTAKKLSDYLTEIKRSFMILH